MTSESTFGKKAALLGGGLVNTNDVNSTSVADAENNVTTSQTLDSANTRAEVEPLAASSIVALSGQTGSQFQTVPDFHEKNLANGSAPNTGSVTQTISLKSGYTPRVADWETDSSGNPIFEGQYGHLTWNASSSTLTYTLTKSPDNRISGNASYSYEDFEELLLLDSKGNLTESSLAIKIFDDSPSVELSVKNTSITAGEQIEGSVLAQYGADGVSSAEPPFIEIADANDNFKEYFVDKAGTHEVIINKVFYGILTVNADGTFSLDTGNCDQGAHGSSLTLKAYVYDEDSLDAVISSAVKVSIAEGEPGNPGPDPTPGGEPGKMPTPPEFHEKYLSLGTEAGKGNVTQEIALPDGCKPDTTGWTQESGLLTLQGSYGKLTWNESTGKLEYTLTTAPKNDAPGGASDATQSESFDKFKVTTADGTAYDRPFAITIHDDIPVASISSDQTSIEPGESLVGKWSILFGADGAPTSATPTVEAFTPDGHSTGPIAVNSKNFDTEINIDGKYCGYLILKDDGTFIFDSDGTEMESGSLRITVSGVDGDGDAFSASFTASLGDPGPVNPVEPGEMPDRPDFHEKHLEKGTAADSAALSQDIPLPEGCKPSTEGWTQEDGSFVLVGSYGKLTWTESTGKLQYTLTAAPENSAPGLSNDSQQVESFDKFKVVAQDGNIYDRPFSITIMDDSPEVTASGVSGTSVKAGEQITGEYRVSFGADGPADGDDQLIAVITINGQNYEKPFVIGSDITVAFTNSPFGKFSFGFNNNFSFTADPGAPDAEVSVAIIAKDGDGDTVTKTIAEFSVVAESDPVPGPGEIELEPLLFNESSLPEGLEPNPGNLTQVIDLKTLPDAATYEWAIDITEWTTIPDGLMEKVEDNIRLQYNPDQKTITVTLTGPTSHPGQGTDVHEMSIPVTVVDKYGNTYSPNIGVHIKDDAPEVDFDYTPQTHYSGNAIDIPLSIAYGADGKAENSALSITYRDADGNVTEPFAMAEGQNKEIIINSVKIGDLLLADGKLVFTPLEDKSGSATFTVTATDGDGDQSNDSVTVQFAPKDKPGPIDPPLITFDAFDEGYLPEGSLGHDQAALTKTIDFDPDWTIDTSSGWTQDGTSNIWTKEYAAGVLTFDGDKHTLTTTLDRSVEHPAGGNNTQELTVNLSLVHKESGTTASSQITIAVKDDAPEVDFDYTPQTHYSGDAIDIPLSIAYGADGKAENNALSVTYKDADGNATEPFALAEGENKEIIINGVKIGDLQLSSGKLVFTPLEDKSGSATFTVTATDSDGDQSSDEVTVKFAPEPVGPPPTGVLVFDEAYLQEGSLGHNPNELTKTVDIDPSWTIDTSSGWTQAGTGNTWTMEYAAGTITFDDDSSTFTVTLDRSIEHDTPGKDSQDLKIDISLINKENGSTYPVEMNITVKDDEPVVDFDYTPQTHYSGDAIEIPLSIAYGADGKAENSALSITYRDADGNVTEPFAMAEGQNKEIIINSVKIGDLLLADGKLVFTPLENMSGSATFTVTATDGDGDQSSDSVTVQFAPKDEPGPNPSYDFQFDEANLPGGTAPDSSRVEETLDLPVGFALKLTQDWVEKDADIFTRVVSEALTLVYDKTANSITCLLSKAMTHAEQGTDIFDNIEVPLGLEDAEGNSEQITLNISVKDDAPVVSVELNSNTVTSGEPFIGKLNFAFGADGQANESAIRVTVRDADGQDASVDIVIGQEVSLIEDGMLYATILLEEDGTFIFTPAEGVKGTYTVTVAVTDGDGDVTTEDVTVTITDGDTPGPDPDFPVSLEFDESHLANGTAPDAAMLEQVLDIPSGYFLKLTTEWKEDTDGVFTRVLSNSMTLVYTELDESLVCRFSAPVNHSSEGSDLSAPLEVDLALTDANGNNGTLQLSLLVKDDVPTVSVNLDTHSTTSGEPFTGKLNVAFGADGQANESAIRVTVQDAKGQQASTDIVIGQETSLIEDGKVYATILLEEDGSFTFTPADGVKGTFKVTVVVTDGDGDSEAVTEEVTVVVNGEGPDPLLPLQIEFDEGKLPGGNDPLNTTTVTVANPVDGTLDTTDWNTDVNGIFFFGNDHLRCEYDSSANTFSFTLLKPYWKAQGDGSTNVIDGPKFTFTDANGNKVTLPVKLSIIEDRPELIVEDATFVQAGQEVTYDWNVAFGADGEKTGGGLSLAVRFPNGETSTLPVTADGTSFEIKDGSTTYGWITFNAGSYSFRAADDVPTDILKFTLSATDGDGDTVSRDFDLMLSTKLPSDLQPVHLTFLEMHLPDGSNSWPEKLVQDISLPRGYTLVTDEADGWHLQPDGSMKLEGDCGYLSLSSDGYLTYTFGGSLQHNNSAQAEDGGITVLTVKDQAGAEYVLPITVTVEDDSPILTFDNMGSNQEIKAGETFAGAWSVRYGADGPKEVGSDESPLTFLVRVNGVTESYAVIADQQFDVTVNGVTYGTMVFSADGKYTFITNPKVSETASLYFSLKGEDTDSSTLLMGSAPDITIIPSIGPTPPLFQTISVDEASLETGSNPNTGDLVQSITVPNGWTINTGKGDWHSSSSGIYEADVTGGKLTYNAADNTLTLTLTEAVDQSNGSLFTLGDITLVDMNGNTSTVPLQVTILDDTPELNIKTGGDANVELSGAASGTLDIEFGADFDRNTDSFTLKLFFNTNSNGDSSGVDIKIPLDGTWSDPSETQLFTYEFRYNPDSGKIEYRFQNYSGSDGDKEQITLVYTDADGSESSVNFTHTLSSDTPVDPLPVDVLTIDEALDEAALAWGSAPDQDALAREIPIPDGWTVNTSTGGWQVVDASAPNVLICALETGYLYYDADANRLIYDMNAAFDNTNGDTFTLGSLELQDADGNTVERSIFATVEDDQPLIGVSSGGDATLDEASGYTASGELDIRFGADMNTNATSFELVVGYEYDGTTTKQGSDTVTLYMDGRTTTLQTPMGELTLAYDKEKGCVTYSHKATHTSSDASESLTFTYVDADGSQTDADFIHTLKGSGPVDPITPGELHFTGFEESSLAWGSAPSLEGRTKAVDMPEGWRVDLTSGEWEQLNVITGEDIRRLAMDNGYLEYCADTNELTFTITAAFDNSNGDSFKLEQITLVHDDGTTAKAPIVITVKDDEPVFDVISGGDATLNSVNGYNASGVLDLRFGADADRDASTFTLKVTYDYDGTTDSQGSETVTLAKDGSAPTVVQTAMGELTLTYNPDTGKVEYSYKANTNGDSAKESLQISYTDTDGSGSDVEFTHTYEKGAAPSPGYDYNSVSVYAPGFDDSAVLGSFSNKSVSLKEGWVSGNAAWVSGLPEGMLPFPSDSALEGMSDNKAIRLQSASMSARNVDKFIGEDNSLVDILSDIGIETNGYYVSDKYNSRIGMTSKTFSSEGGEITFNWSFAGRAGGGESDAAFWVLLDANDNIVDSGKIVHLQDSSTNLQYENGVTKIPVPHSDGEMEYKLVLGTVDGGSANYVPSRLYVDAAVLQEGKYLFAGNIYTDPSADGDKAPVFVDPIIQSVTLEDGTTYTFTSDKPVAVIELEDGILTINRETGAYKFNTYDGQPAPLTTVVKYNVTDSENHSGTISQVIQLDSPKAYDNNALAGYGYETVDRLGSFESSNRQLALDDNDWLYTGNIYTGRGFIHADTLPLPGNDVLDDYNSGSTALVRLRAASNIGSSARQAIFGTKDTADIKEILNDIGIEGSNFGYRDGSTGIDTAIIQKSFTSSGGAINFAWSFYTGTQEQDAGFWMLKDSKGNIIQSGVLHQGPGKSNGIVDISLADSSSPEEYTLVIGALNVGTKTGLDPLLYVGDILYLENEYQFKGNVLTDPGPDGQTDFIYSDTKLASFTHEGQTKYFDENNTKQVFETDSGKLVVDWEGNYYFAAKDGNSSSVAEKFEYTLQGAAEGDSAVLTVQQTPSQVFSQSPELLTGGENDVLGKFDVSLKDSGWTKDAGSVTSNVSLPRSFDTPPSDEKLQEYDDGKYLRLSSANALTHQQWTNVLGSNKGANALGDMLDQLGAEGDIWREASPKASFASTTFTSNGGKVTFDWSYGGRAQADKDYDAAFCFIKDSSGNIVQQILLSQLLTNSAKGVYVYKNGVCTLNLPYSSTEETYTLTIGTVQMGVKEYSTSYLYVGTVLHSQDSTLFGGNMLQNDALHGQLNALVADAILSSITYNGKEYTFTDSEQLSITTDGGGVLTVNSNGSYSFKHPEGGNATVLEDFSYTVKDGSGHTDTAMLHLRTDGYKVEDVHADMSSSNSSLYYDTTADAANIVSGGGSDLIYAADRGVTINANGGDDYVYGGIGNDSIDGGAGNDIIYGGGGNDSIFGSEGNDLIYGGSGNNILKGGTGADTFGWKHVTDLAGKDQIADFSLTEGDKLGFSDLLAENETLDRYLNSHVVDLKLETGLQDGTDILSFTIQDHLYSKDVNVVLNPSESGYAEIRSAYIEATDQDSQLALLNQLLLNISS